MFWQFTSSCKSSMMLKMLCVCVCVHIQSCLTLRPHGLWSTMVHYNPQALLSMEFSRQEYWSGLPFPPPGNLPDPGIKPTSLASPALAGRFFTSSTTWEALKCYNTLPPVWTQDSSVTSFSTKHFLKSPMIPATYIQAIWLFPKYFIHFHRFMTLPGSYSLPKKPFITSHLEKV